MFEIEYKYLLTELPPVPESARILHIRQYYLPGADISERIAKYWPEGSNTPVYVRTIKYPAVGAKRIEVEEEISLQLFEFLLNCCTHMVSKIRYKIPYGNVLWEIDVIDQPGQPSVVIAELECDAEQAAVDLPDEIRARVVSDVTNNPRYRANALATELRRLEW